MRLGEFGLELSLMRIKATERIVTAAQLSGARLMSRKIGYSVQRVADVVMRRKPCNAMYHSHGGLCSCALLLWRCERKSTFTPEAPSGAGEAGSGALSQQLIGGSTEGAPTPPVAIWRYL